jgi:hypothetical protein
MFELPPLYKPMGVSKQMQGMDRKYDSHTWCKVKTTNIKNFLVWAFEVLNVWTISDVQTILVLCFSDLVLAMKSTGTTICPKFLLLMKLFRFLCLTRLLVRYVVSPPCVYRLVCVACIMWFIRCQICQD